MAKVNAIDCDDFCTKQTFVVRQNLQTSDGCHYNTNQCRVQQTHQLGRVKANNTRQKLH